MASRSMVRASDADREHVAQRLRQATAEGRLTAEELEDRLHTAFSARTYGELDPLVADLPLARTTTTLAPLPKTSGMAIASMVMAFLWMGGVGSLAAIVLGLLARKEISASHGHISGRGLALAGIVVGCVGVLGAAAMVLLSAATHLIGHPVYYR